MKVLQNLNVVGDITSTKKITINNAVNNGNYATALGYQSYAGIRTGDSTYPYAQITPYNTQAIIYEGKTVYGIQIAPGSTVEYTYNEVVYNYTNENKYYYFLVVIKDEDGLLYASSSHPRNKCKLTGPNGSIGTTISNITDVTDGIKQIIVGSYITTKSNRFIFETNNYMLFVYKKNNSSDYSGNSSVASGYYSVASGNSSVASGYSSVASGNYSVASGYYSVASGYYSVASGYYSVASHTDSKVFAKNGISGANAQTVLGMFNEKKSNSALIVGWGTSDSDRKNIFQLSTSGELEITDSIKSVGLTVSVDNVDNSYITINDEGIAGYYDTNPNSDSSWVIDFSGNAKFYSISDVSDERLKNITDNVHLELEEIVNAPLVKFTWVNRTDDSNHIGTIAQYWMNILPEVVKPIDCKGHLGVEYSVLSVAIGISLAKELKELKDKINMLEKQIN